MNFRIKIQEMKPHQLDIQFTQKKVDVKTENQLTKGIDGMIKMQDDFPSQIHSLIQDINSGKDDSKTILHGLNISFDKQPTGIKIE